MSLYKAVADCFVLLSSETNNRPTTLAASKVTLCQIKSLFIAACGRLSLFPSYSLIEVCDFLHSSGLVMRTTVELCRNDRVVNRIYGALSELRSSDNGPDFTLADLYQYLLMLEVFLDNDGFSVSNTKTQRDASGSYYTPPDIARSVVQRTFTLAGHFECKHDSCVDLSCGAGDFLVEAFRWLVKQKNCASDAFLALHGYDIDPIALSITVMRLTHLAGMPLSDSIAIIVAAHFHLGNPLLAATECSTTSEDKIRLFAVGLYYDPGMAFDVEVCADNSFKVILGNPPWEKIRMEERKFFRLVSPTIGSINNKRDRHKAVDKLRSTDGSGIVDLFDRLSSCYSEVRKRVIHKVSSAVDGELNTYALFTALSVLCLKDSGAAGLVLKSALFTSPVNSRLFASLSAEGAIDSVYLFNNSSRIFPIDRRERFCVAFFSKMGKRDQFAASFGNTNAEFLTNSVRMVTSNDLASLNPDTKTLPDLDNGDLFNFLLVMHNKFNTFSHVYPNCHFGRLVHLTTHANWITKEKTSNNLPIFEGKFIGPHDIRYATFAGLDDASKYASKATARKMEAEEKLVNSAEARYFIDSELWHRISRKYSDALMLCWRSLTSSTNTRTSIAALSPFVPACQSVQFLQLENTRDLVILAGLFNSKIFDYLVRLKLPGIDLTQKVIGQIPVPPKEVYGSYVNLRGKQATLGDAIVERVVELYENEPQLIKLLETKGVVPARVPLDRNEIFDELDTLFYMAYDLTEKEIEMVDKSFSD